MSIMDSNGTELLTNVLNYSENEFALWKHSRPNLFDWDDRYLINATCEQHELMIFIGATFPSF